MHRPGIEPGPPALAGRRGGGRYATQAGVFPTGRERSAVSHPHLDTVAKHAFFKPSHPIRSPNCHFGFLSPFAGGPRALDFSNMFTSRIHPTPSVQFFTNYI